MKYAVWLTCFCATALAALAQTATAPPDDPAAAVLRVGDKTITRQALQNTLGLMRQQGDEPMTEQQLLDMAVSQLIRNNVLLILAEEAGIVVSDDDVARRIEAMREASPTPEAFTQSLKERGLSEEDLARNVHDAMMTQAFVVQCTKDVAVSETSIRTEYDRMERAGFLNKPESVDFYHILAATRRPDAETSRRAEEKIRTLYKKIEDGASFEDVARKESDDVSSERTGGLKRGITRNTLAPELERVIFTAELNKVSEPFKSRYGWHIIKTVRHHQGGKLTYDEVKPEIEARLKLKKSHFIIEQMVQAALERIPVEPLAPENEEN